MEMDYKLKTSEPLTGTQAKKNNEEVEAVVPPTEKFVPVDQPATIETPSSVGKTIFNNHGDGLQVANLQNLNATFNVIAAPAQDGRHSIANEYYNLIVGYDPENTNHIREEHERFLTEYIKDDVKVVFLKDGTPDLKMIQSLPAIITEEYDRKRAHEQTAFLAIIDSIQEQENGILVYYKRYLPIPMLTLTANLDEFGIMNINELHRTHWTIKHVSLLTALQDAGMGLFGAGEN